MEIAALRQYNEQILASATSLAVTMPGGLCWSNWGLQNHATGISWPVLLVWQLLCLSGCGPAAGHIYIVLAMLL